MKQTLILFFTLVVSTMCVDDIYMNQLDLALPLTREEVETCVNKTNVTVEDISHFNDIVEDNLRTKFDDTALKIGCLLACLCKNKDLMTGAHMKMDKIHDMVAPQHRIITPELSEHLIKLDACGDKVKGNECEASLKFIVCAMNTMNTRRPR